ncbi:hypothetical protein HDV06_005711 [Boothiomyces sp. JEL0866]|nr:hypothetical protein HDV06_005711 [Boothiomyces sp. JEL0866]
MVDPAHITPFKQLPLCLKYAVATYVTPLALGTGAVSVFHSSPNNVVCQLFIPFVCSISIDEVQHPAPEGDGVLSIPQIPIPQLFVKYGGPSD